VGIAKKFASLKSYRLDVSQELIALGSANIIGSVFKSYPVTGSISRSAINFQIGSCTPLSSVLVGFLVMFVLLFLTPLLELVPTTVLSAIVITAALHTINPFEWVRLFRAKEYLDFFLSNGVLFLTLMLGPDIGAVIAVVISLIIVIYRSSRPHFVRVGRLPGTVVYKDVRRFPDAITFPGVLIVRLDGMLSFYTTSHLREKLEEWEVDSDPPVHTIIIDSVGINGVDSSGHHLLSEILEVYEKRSIRVLFSEMKGRVRDSLARGGLDKKVGLNNFFLTTHEAVMHVEQALGVYGKGLGGPYYTIQFAQIQ